MAVRFVVDSASDILAEQARELGVLHVPIKVLFGEREYLDGVDLSHQRFYELLVESDVLPTTSQASPADFADAYEQALAGGDDVVVITVSGLLSGTYQSAAIAAADYEGRVFVVDSRSVAVGERILLLRGLELAQRGLSAREVACQLEAERGKIRVMALLDTLEYLKRGGRISAATAFAGGLLAIKPVIAVEEGVIALVGKARGSKQGNNLLRQLVERVGVDFGKPFALAYSGLDDSLLRKYISDSAELWQGAGMEPPVHTVGCAIGAHAGPGAVAVAFFEQ